MTYTTTNGRILITDLDLSYAAEKDGEIRYSQIKNKQKAAIIEAPTKSMATYIQRAISAPPTFLPRNADIREALTDVVPQAAHAHKKCLASMNTIPVTLEPYPYVYETNQGRYAITRDLLSPRKLCENFTTLREELLTVEELATICFIPEHPIAIYVARATAGTFVSPAIPAHNPNIYHNAAVENENGIMILDGHKHRSLPAVLASNASDTTLRIMLNKVILQKWICDTYLALATA